MLKFDSTVIIVKEIKIMKQFYSEVLGFTVKFDFGESISFNEGISIWSPSDVHEITQYYTKMNARQNSNLELYFETEDIEGSFNKIKETGAKFLHTLKEEPWEQKTFRFFDPEENLVEVGESLPALVKRLLKTNTRDEVISLTGISEEDMKKLGF